MSYIQTYALQAITTKYLGPTDHRGSRVVARSASGHRLTLPWDHALDNFANHRHAALTLAGKLAWPGPWIGGAIPSGYVFVTASDYGDASEVEA